MRKLFAIFFSTLVALNLYAAVKIERIAKDLEQTKQAVVDKEVKQRRILSSLYVINKKLKKIVTERSSLEKDHQMLEANNFELTKKIETLEEKVRTQRSSLLLRLTAIYKFGGQGMARFLFSSSSSAELERNLKILGFVASKDVGLIKDYSLSAKELEVKKARMTKRLARLKKVEEKIFLSENLLKSETDSKSKILDHLKKTKQFELTKLALLREQTQKMKIDDDGLLDLLAGPAFFEQKGKLTPPVSGKLVRGFGLIKHADSNVVLSHKGHFYRAKSGELVSSVFAGKVVFSGRILGYGKTLIIDHGDHYYSLYAHAKDLLVHEGQQIQGQERIAVAGNSLSENGEGIYFEIRHFSEPYDPKAWMKGNSL